MNSQHALIPGNRQRLQNRKTEHGHTLVELMVVTTLMTMLTFMIAQVWRPIAVSTTTLRERAVASTEVGLAADFCARILAAQAPPSTSPKLVSLSSANLKSPTA
ncbi:MAG: prepilin-type N-terminal cleavage/methylation domain-containing protein [Planctomycetes bacterium]|nr:prepilin-type N-terminal cleavage/methylation domain-containing protein [Planctomycetota bacterium]